MKINKCSFCGCVKSASINKHIKINHFNEYGKEVSNIIKKYKNGMSKIAIYNETFLCFKELYDIINRNFSKKFIRKRARILQSKGAFNGWKNRTEIENREICKKISKTVHKWVDAQGSTYRKKENNGMYGKHTSRRQKEITSKLHKGRTFEEKFGKERADEIKLKMKMNRKYVPREEVNRRISNTLSNRVKEGYIPPCLSLRCKSRKMSNGEKFLDNYFQQKFLSYTYTGDSKFWINLEGICINPDFVHKQNKKLFVEVYGCHWHGCKICYPNKCKNIKARLLVDKVIERDILKKKLLEKYGYAVIYIWEHELKDGSFINKLKY